jgi:hypothetical protein
MYAVKWSQCKTEELPRLTGEDMQKGVTLAKYFLDQSIRVRGGRSPAAAPAERVLSWIKSRRSCSPFVKRDVQRSLYRLFPSAESLSAPLKLLVQHGYLRYLETTDGTRRNEATYEPHPAITTKSDDTDDICQKHDANA